MSTEPSFLVVRVMTAPFFPRIVSVSRTSFSLGLLLEASAVWSSILSLLALTDMLVSFFSFFSSVFAISVLLGSGEGDRKSTRLNSSHGYISYAVFCLKKKKQNSDTEPYFGVVE